MSKNQSTDSVCKNNSYHTNLKIKYRLGLMTETEAFSIPYTTRKGWDNLVL